MQAPRMDANYLSDERDWQEMIAGTRLVRDIARMPALADISDGEWHRHQRWKAMMISWMSSASIAGRCSSMRHLPDGAGCQQRRC